MATPGVVPRTGDVVLLGAAASVQLASDRLPSAGMAVYDSMTAAARSNEAAQSPLVPVEFVRDGIGRRARHTAGAHVYRALLLTGVAGVGKSTVADAAGRVLTTAGNVTAVVDTDMLAQFGPPPSTGPAGYQFYDELKCANLAAVWANFKAAGARFVIAAAVIDGPTQRDLYAESLAGCEVHLVRLIAGEDTVRSRLRGRDTGPRLEQHLRALEEHRLVPPSTVVEDFTVTNDRAAADVATEIIARAGWADHAR